MKILWRGIALALLLAGVEWVWWFSGVHFYSSFVGLNLTILPAFALVSLGTFCLLSRGDVT